MLGNSRVNTVRVARTWEHWWHGNACFRAQGPTGGPGRLHVRHRKTSATRRCARRSWTSTSFLGQASTESQGPWDSNYQIEDDYSWFVPGKQGDHDMKFGARYNYTELRRVSQVNSERHVHDQLGPAVRSGTIRRTYPERLTIRTGDLQRVHQQPHRTSFSPRTNGSMSPRTTLSLGLRYDLEIIPLDETDNPLFKNLDKKSPVDKNNFAPRIGFTHSLDEAGKSVIRGGYGIFYNRTILGALDDTLEFRASSRRRTSSTSRPTAPIPGQAPGGCRPIRILVNGPFVNRTLLNQAYPPGVPVKNDGVVIFDSPDRKLPYAHQFTIGYVARADVVARAARRLRARGEQGHVPGAQPQPGAARRHEPHRCAHAV